MHGLASDERLATRAGRGDADAFAAIFRRYESDLYRFCLGILGEPQDAQDAIQNTMLKVLRALPGERRDIQLKPWLYRIAHNEAVELRRRRRPIEPLEAGIADAAVSVEERAERSERLQVLFRDMTDLPERQRAALVMRELNGLEFGEIGAALGTSPSAVRQALYEARRGLQQMELGRHMDCDAVTRVLSDDEARLRGRRDVRAHLRECPDCRCFRRAISDRKETLAAISPLPAFIAAGLVKSALAGTGAGSASAGAGGAGAAAGVVGGAAGSSGLVKTVAGVLAVVAIGTAAADRSGLVALQGERPGPAVERDTGSADPARRDAPPSADARSEAELLGLAGVVPAQASPRSDSQMAPGGIAERSSRSDQTAKIGQGSGSPAALTPARSEPALAAAGPHLGPVTTGTHQSAATTEGGSAAGSESPSSHPEDSAQSGDGPNRKAAAKTGNSEGSETKTQKAEARTEMQEAKAEEMVEKKQAKAQEKSENAPPKAEAKPAKGPKSALEGGGSPHPEQSLTETPPPATGPEPIESEPTAAPVATSTDNGIGNAFGSENGNGPTKKEAAAPSQ